MDIQQFKQFIKRSRSQTPLGPLNLLEHPTWKEIMNTYPFIHDYCDPMTACHDTSDRLQDHERDEPCHAI